MPYIRSKIRFDPLELIRGLENIFSGKTMMLPQQYLRIVAEILQHAPANVLVFGSGRDTELYLLANPGGRTVVLEDNPKWLKSIEHLNCEAFLVTYTTRLDEGFLENCPWPDGVPDEVSEQKWDIVLVDAPRGYGRYPGRQQSILLASELAATTGVVFVHDYQREMEHLCSNRLLGQPTDVVGPTPQLAVFRTH